MVTMYRAAQIAGVNKSSIIKQSKKLPPPPYFYFMADGYYMIDEKSEAFRAYCKKIKKRRGAPKGAQERFKILLKAVVDTLTAELDIDQERLQSILIEIDRRYNNAL